MWGTVLKILLPIVAHFVEKAVSKDKSAMSVEELAVHEANVEALKVVDEHVKKIQD